MMVEKRKVKWGGEAAPFISQSRVQVNDLATRDEME
jgi:hypothetical protein